MNINEYLRTIASKLTLSEVEKSGIQTSIETFKQRMCHYFTYDEYFDILDISVFGSYDRGTALPRKADDESDVDIMVVFKDDGSTPQTYLNRIRRAVEKYYSTSEIKQSSPTIVLDMNHIRFEITPAKNWYGSNYIKRNDDWVFTNALDDLNNLTVANKNNDFLLKPIIRLVKYWNTKLNYKYCPSHEIEKNIVDAFFWPIYGQRDYKTMLLSAFKAIKSLDPIAVSKVITVFEEAIGDEQQYPYTSLSKIKKVIPEL